jgi:hypothetical protein
VEVEVFLIDGLEQFAPQELKHQRYNDQEEQEQEEQWKHFYHFIDHEPQLISIMNQLQHTTTMVGPTFPVSWRDMAVLSV